MGQARRRVYLSPPDVGMAEREALLRAFDSGWIAPLGPQVDEFERRVASRVGRTAGAALASGTAALHLALRLAGVGAGDRVYVSTLTFVASANAVRYLQAEPVFIDSARDSWTMDPALLAEALRRDAARGRLPAAVVVVDLYGQCADYRRIEPLCREHGVPLVEDAAESLGARVDQRPAGSFGQSAILSFNGNKIITTSGGGMLVADDADQVARARWLAAQAREPAAHYEHETVGYNYRLSNLLAGLGLAQLETLDDKVQRRRDLHRRYRAALEPAGIEFIDEPAGHYDTHWLTAIQIPEAFGACPAAIREQLESVDIESRPLWKPLHLQPAYRGAEVIGGAVAEERFARGLCLPSGSNLSAEDFERTVAGIFEARQQKRQERQTRRQEQKS
ncbi:MAG: aminotransferase class I/II-fold pyridoxal phosphate-dependent enzyme [Myxococcota bacterium]